MGRLRYIRLTRRQRVRVWLAIILLALTALRHPLPERRQRVFHA